MTEESSKLYCDYCKKDFNSLSNRKYISITRNGCTLEGEICIPCYLTKIDIFEELKNVNVDPTTLKTSK